ncbi:MAG: bifunctional 2-C-methyl-D-erythritol 4-phosphate cytidylyltransferase/2-C-methyl-D-erythritol 2,4-cyclodiphosphate synthase [Sphingomonadales bacterium]
MTVAAIIVAAGRGRRFGGELPKQYVEIAGKPVLYRTAAAFAGHPAIDRVVVVINPADRSLYDEAVAGLDLDEPADGGASRQESVLRGLESLITDGRKAPKFVLIHDAARPFVSPALIDRVIDGLARAPCALPALAVCDTLKRSRDGFVEQTVDRTGLWRAQTPQGFHFNAILEAHRQVIGLELTDDAAVAEHAGLKIALVEGDEENFKVTMTEDQERAERLLSSRLTDIRVGSGFDVHRFTDGDHVMLCGVRIAHTAALAGHSDADVGLHAITDAVLGALGEGDIGDHFPPSDEKWRGAASSLFLRHAADLVAKRGGRVAHIDVTLICEAPKIGPHRDAMKARVAEILGVPPSRVSIKATTTEHLGFTGRSEGLAAQATATIRLPSQEN